MAMFVKVKQASIIIPSGEEDKLFKWLLPGKHLDNSNTSDNFSGEQQSFVGSRGDFPSQFGDYSTAERCNTKYNAFDVVSRQKSKDILVLKKKKKYGVWQKV